MSAYAFHAKFGGTMDEAVQQVTEELKKEGFGILTEINVQAVLKKKLDLDRRPYLILGACNPHLASQAIEAESDIGVLLPCNVIVREEEDGSITLAFMEPSTVLGVVGREDLAPFGEEVSVRLHRVCKALGG